MLWLSTSSRKRCQVTMGEKNFCLALFFSLQPAIIILIPSKRTRSAFWGLSGWMKQAPLSVGDYRQGGSFPPIPDYTEHSYNRCYQTAWCSSSQVQIPAHPHGSPCKALLLCCSFSGAGCRQADKWQVSLWKYKTSPSQATNPAPARQGRS